MPRLSSIGFAAALEALGLTADELLADVDTLTAVLTYHVVPGRVMAGGLVGAMAMPVATVNGADITITEDGGTVSVNGAHVVSADIEASNGVIHVIDQVLSHCLHSSLAGASNRMR